MPPTESKLKNGTLTIGGESFASQASNVRITPGYDESGDSLELLDGGTLSPDEVRTDTLTIVSVQDFTNPAGFQKFAWDNDGMTVPFEWAPTGATGPSFTGEVKIRAVEVGGDVNRRLTVDAEWTVQGKAEWVPPVGA